MGTIRQHRCWISCLSSPLPKTIPTLCIEVTKSQAAQAADFFTTIYDGEYDDLPLGLKFFFSMYNCAASDSDHSTLAQEQEHFLCSEWTITIKGLHSLESKVHLATPGNPMVSIRSILLLLPTTNLVPLFHGIDRQHDPSIPYILAKYPEQHAAELINAIPTMDAALKLCIHSDDHKKVFIDVNEGLTFGAKFQNYKNKKIHHISFHNPSETSWMQLTNILTKIILPYPNILPQVLVDLDPHPKNRHGKMSPSHLQLYVCYCHIIHCHHGNQSTHYWLSQWTNHADIRNETGSSLNKPSNHQCPHWQTWQQHQHSMDTLNSSIQSLVLTSHTNFGLLLEQFGISPAATDPLMANMTIINTHAPPDEMEVDVINAKMHHALGQPTNSYTILRTQGPHQSVHPVLTPTPQQPLHLLYHMQHVFPNHPDANISKHEFPPKNHLPHVNSKETPLQT